MENSAWNSMKRVHSLFSVAKCFAAKGVEKDDEPALGSREHSRCCSTLSRMRLTSRWRKLANPPMTSRPHRRRSK